MINSMNSLFKTQILCFEFSLIIINTLQDSLVKNKTKSVILGTLYLQHTTLSLNFNLITFSMPCFTVVRRRKFLISLCNGHFFVQKCINILIDQKPDIRIYIIYIKSSSDTLDESCMYTFHERGQISSSFLFYITNPCLTQLPPFHIYLI